MSGRPFSTFASEGWLRPGRARKHHYFRPSDESSWALKSLCRGYAGMDGLRPRLVVDVKLSEKCSRCEKLWVAGAMSDDASWFGEPAGE